MLLGGESGSGVGGAGVFLPTSSVAAEVALVVAVVGFPELLSGLLGSVGDSSDVTPVEGGSQSRRSS